MKLTPYLVIALLVTACSGSSSNAEGSNSLPTGAEIGETVAERTRAEKDRSAVIIASSEDGAEEASTDDAAEAAEEGHGLDVWVEVDAEGTMRGAGGEKLGAIPRSTKADAIVVAHGPKVSPETVAKAVSALKEAGWGRVTAVALAHSTTVDADAADPSGADEATTPASKTKTAPAQKDGAAGE